jgi:hypothetical protein
VSAAKSAKKSAPGFAFRLMITLGNDAMLTRDDVSRALAALAMRLADGPRQDGDRPFTEDEGGIKDDNGNTVGSWGVK